jgi:AraC-like DNA-binding protein
MTTAIDGVSIMRAEEPLPPSASMTGTIMALIVQGAKRIALGDQVNDYRAGQYLVASVDLPVSGHFFETGPGCPALGFGLALRPADIAELLRHNDIDCDDAAAPGLAVLKAPDELLDAVVRLLRLLDRPQDVKVLAPMIIKEILWRLVSGEAGSTVVQLGLPGSGLSRIARSVRWIRENYSQAFQVRDLAELSGMSVSAFHRNFQTVTAMSPVQFQKQIRLQNARLLLASSPHDVAEVCYRMGYDSPSQFSREYRRQFGAPPTQDAARLRDPSH